MVEASSATRSWKGGAFTVASIGEGCKLEECDAGDPVEEFHGIGSLGWSDSVLGFYKMAARADGYPGSNDIGATIIQNS